MIPILLRMPKIIVNYLDVSSNAKIVNFFLILHWVSKSSMLYIDVSIRK